ncbi:kinase [Pyrrhoderma noxium]|uniref:Kinase n=1 Tax=Pyrrhoderma noxium TaxID=2282107 RepID=A0A286UDG7_9AGAM|nr:kinase [Pyrrhoderma noxium]
MTSASGTSGETLRFDTFNDIGGRRSNRFIEKDRKKSGRNTFEESKEDHLRGTSESKFRDELSGLAHLDKSGLVRKEDGNMQGHGSFCDLFIGVIERENINSGTSVEQSGSEIRVAIKRLRVNISHDKDFLKPFVKELRVWSRLTHPNILPLIGYFMEGDYPSILSEWMEKGTARRFISDTNLSVDNVLSMLLGVAKGVNYLHDNGVIHSDLKAENILISPSNKPLICDFGVSRIINSSTASKSTTGFARGTMRFMAPELFSSESPLHTKATDIWSLGMTFYEIISKGFPFAEKTDVQVIFHVLNQGIPDPPASLQDWGAQHPGDCFSLGNVHGDHHCYKYESDLLVRAIAPESLKWKSNKVVTHSTSYSLLAQRTTTALGCTMGFIILVNIVAYME